MTTATQKPRVAFQGEHGAFSEEAALKLLGEHIELVPRRTFADLYDSLDSGLADYILAPVENSIAGVVQPSVDLLQTKSLNILNEIQINIEQHLIGCPGATLDTIQTVQSHPTALAQCSRFFETHPQLKCIVADDTAGSVAEVIRRRDPKRAAIAGQRAADLYSATILRRNIQDHSENYTRFVLLSAPAEQIPNSPTLLVKEHAS
ncbi:MAG TPA: prephenate dehydratase domain-containing protein [Pyrinomonadaceae bacterium]|nr:prephenate dehydratase domain-containing protein [Pyrinomonadaceae bacterium]